MVYNRFHKYILGLPFRATNILALGELGRPSFKYFTYLKQVSYWLKISMHDCKRYTKLSFLEQISFADMNYQSWGLDTKKLLCNMGFGHVWFNKGVADVNVFMNIFKLRLQDVDKQDWLSSLQDFDYLRCYKLFKKDKFVEPYVIHLCYFNQRKFLAKFRCGYIDINVNKGRISKIDYAQRVCKYCNSNCVDDEFHFLLVCPYHTDLRAKYIPHYYTSHPNLHKLCSLVNSHSKRVCQSLSNFIRHALNSRHV